MICLACQSAITLPPSTSPAVCRCGAVYPVAEVYDWFGACVAVYVYAPASD